MKRKAFVPWVAAAAFAVWGALPGQTSAETPEEFYSGKTLELIVGYGPGGSNDAYGRAVASHLGKHIPGNPHIVTVNMPGGGSLVAANHLAKIAPQDGTVFGVVASTIPLEAKLGISNIAFDVGDLKWVGRMAANTNLTFVKSETGVTTIEQAREQKVILAADGASSTIAIYPSLMNEMLGTKFELVMGYQGTSGSMLAMERGEADGHSTSLAAVMSNRPQWLRDGSVNVLVQYGLTRHPELADVPTAIELLEDPEALAAMRLILSAVEVGKSLMTTPGIPDSRLEVLQAAFVSMLDDPDFKEELARQRLELTPLSGPDLQRVVDDIAKADSSVVARVRALWPNS